MDADKRCSSNAAGRQLAHRRAMQKSGKEYTPRTSSYLWFSQAARASGRMRMAVAFMSAPLVSGLWRAL